MATPANKLPKKEQELFRLVVTSYENKKYQKGVQTADSILKKFPNHGETQAMKGLIFNCMGKKEEALALVKEGVRNDIRSHVCWHVFGLIHKSDNNFPEAIKCYLNALKIDENNQNILRDLSWLQVQTRDIEGFVASRNKILEAKPSMRASWVSAAVANYMGEQYQVAFDMVTKYRAMSSVDRGDAYEEGELLLFQNMCLVKLRKYDEAIEHLKKHEQHITDKLSVKVKTAEVLVLMGRFDEAKEAWLALVKSQPDNYRYHSGIQTAYLQLDATTSSAMFALKRQELPSTVLSLDGAQLTTLKELYAHLMTLHKRSAANKIAMGLHRGDDEVRTGLDHFMRASLRNAIPSLVQDVCALVRVEDLNRPGQMTYGRDPADFRQNEVAQIALSLVDSYILHLQKSGHFDDSDTAAAQEPPTALLWALYFKCHMHELRGELTIALETIEAAVAHTPTALDMQCKRARIQKKLGDLSNAAITMDECRALDLQDRYLNNKTTKYLLRADDIPSAMSTIAMFTKHEGDPQTSLYELQCNWYELELAEAYARSKQWGLALKKFYAIRRHFTDYSNDMFDFHGYCMRKTTLRAYFDTVHMLDDSWTHKFYQRAARGALRIFLYLHEFPEDVDGLGHLPPDQRKKERVKLKKAKQKAKDKAAEEAAAAEQDSDKEKKKPRSEAEPDEDELLARDFMAEAAAWTAVLSKRLTLCDAETLALLSDFNVRRGEYASAVDAVRIGLQRFPSDPAVTYALVRLALKVRSPGKKGLGPSAPEIRDNVSSLLGSPAGQLDVESFVAAYSEQARQSASLPAILTAMKSRSALDKTAAATTESIAALLESAVTWQGRGVKAATVVEIVKFLTVNYPEEAFTSTFKTQARERFPQAPIFAPLSSVEEIRAAAALAAVTITAGDNGETAPSTGSTAAEAPASA